MGQAKRRGTPDERRELAIAWDDAHREDRERFPPLPRPRRRERGAGWLVLAAALATVCNPNPSR